jgi:hypothetical protein
MKLLYVNEPAPWEEKAAYYAQVKMGKDIQTQTEVMSSATKALISAHMSTASDIIASQARIAEGFDSVGYALDEVKSGISGLAAAFEWGISEVVWQIEQNRELLRNIVEILMVPLDTQAKELKKRADYAFANQWFEDALSDYKASEEKNRYDFTIHMSMGMIYLFNIINKEKALECFEMAVKYARPKSNYHASLALLHKSLCLRDLNRLEEALYAAKEASDLTDTISEAYYQRAVYEALLGHSSENIMDNLKIALDHDKYYALKANSEAAFGEIRKEINACITDVRNSNYEYVNKALSDWMRIVDRWAKFSANITHDLTAIKPDCLDKMTSIIERIDQLIKRNSYFDSVEAKEQLTELELQNDAVKADLNWQLKQYIESLQTSLNAESAILNQQKQEEVRKRNQMGRHLIFISVVAMPLSTVGCVVTELSSKMVNPIFWLTFLGGCYGFFKGKSMAFETFSDMTRDATKSKKTEKYIAIEEKIKKAVNFINRL